MYHANDMGTEIMRALSLPIFCAMEEVDTDGMVVSTVDPTGVRIMTRDACKEEEHKPLVSMTSLGPIIWVQRDNGDDRTPEWIGLAAIAP